MSAKSHIRLVVLQVFAIVLIATIFGRLWYVQVLTGEEYQRAAAANRTREWVVPAVRGQIYDSHGRVLVGNRPALVVSVDRARLEKQDDGGDAVLRRLSKVIDKPVHKIRQQLRLCRSGIEGPCWPGSPYQPIPVTQNATTRMALQILERREEFPAVTARVQAIRQYPRPQGASAAHLLGYLQPITQEELDKRKGAGQLFTGTDLVGRDGLEAEYEEDLRGEPGVRKVAVDSMGMVTGTLKETRPTPGSHVVTSIDARVQGIVEDALERAVQRARSTGLPGDSAAGVVLDVRTGRVVALGSYPTYDPRVWIGGITQKQLDRLLSPKTGSPLISRATQGQYPPGSTFKIASTAAAVKNGADFNGTYDCPGSLSVGGRTFQNFEGIAHGPMDLHRALVVSCDTIFYRFAFQHWLQDGGLTPVKNPRDPIPTMAKKFGMGRPTGIDLPNESDGRIPNREWKREYWKATKDYYCKHAKTGYPDVKKKDPKRAAYLKQLSEENCEDGYKYRAGDAVNLAIGQGDVLVTPLQLANAYATLANGGTLRSPRVGKAIVRPDGETVKRIKPPVVRHLPVQKKTLDNIRDALADVPVSGTAAGAFGGFPLDQVPVAGKTGTAEVYGKDDTSWFASFAPAGNPRFAVVVMASQAGTGAEVAAPAVREIYEGMYGLTDNKPSMRDPVPSTRLPKIAERPETLSHPRDKSKRPGGAEGRAGSS